MPNQITRLEVLEVSLVDRPANASIDPVTGKRIDHAVIALAKRDALAKENRNMDQLETILKSQTATREAIYQAVVARAEVIAKSEGISRDKAESRVWETPGLYGRYLAAEATVPVQSTKPMLTKSERLLDAQIEKRMKETGQSRASATDALLREPDGVRLYKASRQERSALADGSEECQDCGTAVGKTDSFCKNCGEVIRHRARA